MRMHRSCLPNAPPRVFGIMMGMLGLSALFLLMFGVTTTGAEESDGELSRMKRDTTCEAKYSNYSASHTLCLQDNPNATATVLTQAKKDEILKLHNDLRIGVDPTATNMMKLKWDDQLARTAQKWAMQCIGDHDEMKNRQEPDWPAVQIGQNIGMGHTGFDTMIDRFYTEKDRYNYVYGNGYIDDAGHFYQLVSYEAALVGCGEAQCPHTRAKVIRVCNYAPGMNTAQPPYINGTSCGACPNHCDSSGKLCDCGGKLCYNAGEIDLATCQCKCPRGKTGDRCQDVDCLLDDPLPNCRSGGSYSKADCGRAGTLIQDPKVCPTLCGFCDHICGGKNCTSGYTLNKTTCECKCLGDMCDPCPNVKCKNSGVINRDTCKCTCKGIFTGDTCETCPAKDKSDCPTSNKDVVCPADIIKYSCPFFCDLCPNGGGGQDTTTTAATDSPTTAAAPDTTTTAAAPDTTTTATDKPTTVTDNGATVTKVTVTSATDKDATVTSVTEGVTDDGDGGGTGIHGDARTYTHTLLLALLTVLGRAAAARLCHS